MLRKCFDNVFYFEQNEKSDNTFMFVNESFADINCIILLSQLHV